jgi:hypothetical protein
MSDRHWVRWIPHTLHESKALKHGHCWGQTSSPSLWVRRRYPPYYLWSSLCTISSEINWACHMKCVVQNWTFHTPYLRWWIRHAPLQVGMAWKECEVSFIILFCWTFFVFYILLIYFSFYYYILYLIFPLLLLYFMFLYFYFTLCLQSLLKLIFYLIFT